MIDAINRAGNNTYGPSDLQAVEDLIADCGRYVESVTAMEAAQAVARFRLEPKDYQALIVQLDRNRKMAHDTVIADIRLVNRLCGVYSVPPVYEGEDSRIAHAEFAAAVAGEYFKDRKL